eukprot:TRINITY_DN5368_c2_g1_i2.p1 TRINITY_DN5368_c2_g1~~TRINITY_DN5368_c2_g1_i2.p1  ORF type:complete len:476 (+),score=60.85 TRINITY_DN5368_c2_g1_i2:63-1490(+)
MAGKKKKRVVVLGSIGLLIASGVAGLYVKRSNTQVSWSWGLPAGCGTVLSLLTMLFYLGPHDGHLRALTLLTAVPVSLVYPIVPALLWESHRSAYVFVLPGWLYLSFFIQLLLSSPPLAHLRSPAYNLLVSWPATWCSTSSLVTLPLLPAAAWGGDLGAIVCGGAAHLLALIGVIQSALPPPPAARWEKVKVECGPGVPDCGAAVRRLAKRRAAGSHEQGAPLRQVDHKMTVVQLTDLHLGPFMSVQRLRAICEQVVSINPDLVFLTGDFHTPESHLMRDKDTGYGPLQKALMPLSRISTRCFACLGNHDVEQPAVLEGVQRDLAACGIRLLIDQAVETMVRGFPVRIVGLDWWNHGRISPEGTQMLEFLKPECPSFVLLHDPEAFRTVADTKGAGSLVLSGHTHGGQIGLVSCGCTGTIVGTATGHPDHSTWTCGTERLYVHRAQGFRSLACTWVSRLGVPAEYSILEVNWFRG